MKKAEAIEAKCDEEGKLVQIAKQVIHIDMPAPLIIKTARRPHLSIAI
jgi:hypothetical protein